MSAPENKAIFLSYASQDAAAAQRLCEALRSAGIETWFDAEGGLEHGDEWDAKIRQQIKECVLFIPVISASTQAREEGYFRIEWDLAAERARGIATGVAFILPVVIDDTREPDALVPDRFRKVQWTRLPGGRVTPDVQARLLKLWSQRAGVLTPAGSADAAGRNVDSEARAADVAVSAPRRRWPAMFVAGVAVVGCVGALAWWFLREVPPPVNPASAVAPAPMARRFSEAQQLSARAYALTQKLGFIREDLGAAEELARKATELEPESARTWAVRAWVQAAYLNRMWDRSPKRREDAQGFAKRALALDPNDADALNTLAQVLTLQGAFAEAEVEARRAVVAAPDNQRSRLFLGRAILLQGRIDEGRAVLAEAVRRKPGDAIAHYELANTYGGLSTGQSSNADVTTALGHLDAALRVQPFGSALLLKATLLVGRRGDLDGMRAQLDELDKLPSSDRAEDRAVFTAMWAGLLERRPDRAIAAAARTARTYFDDALPAGPKSWGTALAYQMQGKANTAEVEWRTAERVMRQRMQEMPGNPADVVRLATTLAWLGRDEEATREIATVEPSMKEQSHPFSDRALAMYHAARGDAASALPYLYAVLNRTIFLTDHTLLLDPWWQKLRGKPEFETLLAEAKARIASGHGGEPGISPSPAAAAPTFAIQNPPLNPPPVDSKSVAVLAFANLSDDKGNEYFSDGISEELLDVLAKIPGLKVSARTSAFYFKGKQVPIPEIARKLGVAYVVEGSVRKVGTKVRITAQLIKAEDGFHVWSENFDRELKDIFAVQDEIAGLIAKNLQLKLGDAPRVTTRVNPEAYRLYLEGRQAWNLRSVDGFGQAEQLFKRALALEPNFSRAMIGLADVWRYRPPDGQPLLWLFGDLNSPRMRQAIGASDAQVRAALAIDPNLAEAHASLGGTRMGEFRWTEAEAGLRRAIALNPNYATAHHWLALVLANTGYIDEALAEIELASKVDPLAPRIIVSRSMILHQAGRLKEALEFARQAVSLQANSLVNQTQLIAVLVELGQVDEALALARALPGQPPDFTPEAAALVSARALALGAQKSEAETQLNQADRAHTGTYYWEALLALGRNEAFLKGFNADQVETNDPRSLLFLRIFDPARTDPRFLRQIERLGLAEAHTRAQAWRAQNKSK